MNSPCSLLENRLQEPLPLDTWSPLIRQGREGPESLQPTNLGPWHQHLEPQILHWAPKQPQAALDAVANPRARSPHSL